MKDRIGLAACARVDRRAQIGCERLALACARRRRLEPASETASDDGVQPNVPGLVAP